MLVWLSRCIPYQLNIISDNAITQYRTNASEIAHLVRIVCSGLYNFNCLSTYFSAVKIMGVATTTDTTNSVRTSFGILKNLYGISVQVNETTKKKKEKCMQPEIIG